MSRKLLYIIVFLTATLVSSNGIAYSTIPPNKPPTMAIDLIHGYEWSDSVRKQAISLGYQIHEISGSTIQTADLTDTNILLLYVPCDDLRSVVSDAGQLPEYTQTEIQLIANFVEDGGGLYIIPMFSIYYSPYGILDTSTNALYDNFGFKVSGESYTVQYVTKVVQSTHPIMDKVDKIQLHSDGAHAALIAKLSKLQEPSESVYSDEGYPLFLASRLGTGRVFVDLTSNGIGYDNMFDNLLLIRNVLTWLKGISRETYRVFVGNSFYDTLVVSNSTLSAFNFDNVSGTIDFYATGLGGTTGFCNMTIPRNLLWCDNVGDWVVKVDNESVISQKNVDTLNTYLSFGYNHSTHHIEILAQHVVPEISSFLILPLFMTATLLAVIVYRKKHARISGTP